MMVPSKSDRCRRRSQVHDEQQKHANWFAPSQPLHSLFSRDGNTQFLSE